MFIPFFLSISFRISLIVPICMKNERGGRLFIRLFALFLCKGPDGNVRQIGNQFHKQNNLERLKIEASKRAAIYAKAWKAWKA